MSKTTKMSAPEDPAVGMLSGAEDLSVDEAEVKALAQAEKWLNTVELVEVSRKRGVVVGLPQQYKDRNWHVVRVGRVGSPSDEDVAFQLMQKGYIRAPKSVRMTGFESDGDRGIYLMAPPKVYAMMLQLRARAAQRRREILARKLQSNATDALRDAVGRGGDVEVSLSFGHGDMAKLDTELAAVRRATG